MKIFVAGFPFSATDTDLKELFQSFGEVISARVVFDKETRKSRGFGFVEMSDAASGQKAIDSLNGSEVSGRRIVVNEARPR